MEVPLSALLACGPLWLQIDATWFTVKMSGPESPFSPLFDHPVLLKRHFAFKVSFPISMSVQTAAEKVRIRRKEGGGGGFKGRKGEEAKREKRKRKEERFPRVSNKRGVGGDAKKNPGKTISPPTPPSLFSTLDLCRPPPSLSSPLPLL